MKQTAPSIWSSQPDKGALFYQNLFVFSDLLLQRLIHTAVGWLYPGAIPEVDIKSCIFFLLDNLSASLHLFENIMMVKGDDASISTKLVEVERWLELDHFDLISVGFLPSSTTVLMIVAPSA